MRHQSPMIVWPSTPLAVGGGPTLIDSYSESNRSEDQQVAIATLNLAIGQCFTGNGMTLGSCKFYLSKVLSPTGNATARVYNLAGTFGTNASPTGAAIATSDAFSVSTLTGSQALVTFTFSGGNQITLTNGSHYGIAFYYDLGDASNYVLIADDATSPTHAGNAFFSDTSPGNWGSFAGDTCFYVYST